MSDSREDMYRELELADLNPYQGWWLPEDAATLDPGAHAVSGMASSNPEDHLCFIHDIVLGLGPEPKLLVSVCTSRTHYKHKSLPFHPRKRDGSLPDDKGVLTCEPKSSQPTQITNLCLDEFFLISIRMIRHDLKVPIFTPFSHEESQAGRRTHAVKIGGHYTLDAKSIRVARNVSQFARAQWWKETKLLKICDSPKPTLNSSHHCQKAKAGEIVAGHIYKIPGSKGKYRDVVVTALNQDGKRAILFEIINVEDPETEEARYRYLTVGCLDDAKPDYKPVLLLEGDTKAMQGSPKWCVDTQTWGGAETSRLLDYSVAAYGRCWLSCRSQQVLQRVLGPKAFTFTAPRKLEISQKESLTPGIKDKAETKSTKTGSSSTQASSGTAIPAVSTPELSTVKSGPFVAAAPRSLKDIPPISSKDITETPLTKPIKLISVAPNAVVVSSPELSSSVSSSSTIIATPPSSPEKSIRPLPAVSKAGPSTKFSTTATAHDAHDTPSVQIPVSEHLTTVAHPADGAGQLSRKSSSGTAVPLFGEQQKPRPTSFQAAAATSSEPSSLKQPMHLNRPTLSTTSKIMTSISDAGLPPAFPVSVLQAPVTTTAVTHPADVMPVFSTAAGEPWSIVLDGAKLIQQARQKMCVIPAEGRKLFASLQQAWNDAM